MRVVFLLVSQRGFEPTLMQVSSGGALEMKRIAIVVLLITVFLTMCGCRAWSQVEADFERARRGYQEMREAYPQASEEAGKMEQKIHDYEQKLEGLDK